jgi:hypothetical protein
MPINLKSKFNPPCKMPNGLQWTEEGLFVMDQKTDDVYVINQEGYVTGILPTPTENGSGITVGGGYLWTASNNRTEFRDFRPSDTHRGYIYQLDLQTGSFVNRWRTPDGGGVHGLEWDHGVMWVTAFNPKALLVCDPTDDFKVLEKIEVSTERLHGLARDGDGIWCAHTSDKVIIKYSVTTGEETDRIQVPPDSPAPHGLTIRDGELWYADANMVGHGFEDEPRSGPEIGVIIRD